jgi:tRNA dimethylallyltransferase
VRGLLAKHGQLSPTAAEAAGYSELIAHVHGKCSLADAIEQIKISTRQLSRRQMKWFRRFRNVRWIDGPMIESREALNEVLQIIA